jgi:hypothetical protein
MNLLVSLRRLRGISANIIIIEREGSNVNQLSNFQKGNPAFFHRKTLTTKKRDAYNTNGMLWQKPGLPVCAKEGGAHAKSPEEGGRGPGGAVCRFFCVSVAGAAITSRACWKAAENALTSKEE